MSGGRCFREPGEARSLGYRLMLGEPAKAKGEADVHTVQMEVVIECSPLQIST